MSREAIIAQINKDLSLQLTPWLTEEELLQTLATLINDLIQHDFAQLVRMLYRLDISETKLKQLLKDYPDADAGRIIGSMIIERQRQKIASRKQFRQRDEDIPEDEKW